MNTLAWLAGTLAAFWMTVFAFDNLDSTPLGVAMLGVFFLCLGFIISGGIEDISLFSRRGRSDDDD